MQLKIYRRLNQILLLMLVGIILIALAIFLNYQAIEQYKTIIFVLFMFFGLACFFLFKMLEVNWDKRIIQKMALNNEIVVANIKEVSPFLHIKDTANKHYNLWEVYVDYYDHDLKKHEAKLVEKFNANVKSIPNGTIFITHSDEKPENKFIVPNVMISHIESLMPIVQAYEKAKFIDVKYLNVYYNNGLIVETYQDALKNQRQQEEEAETEEENV